METTTFPSEEEWLREMERAVQKMARKWGRNWQEEYAQELRLRVVQAYRNYDESKGMSLKNWSYLCMKDGHAQQAWVAMHCDLGRRNKRESSVALDVDDYSETLEAPTGIEPGTGNLLDAVRREVAAILATRTNAPSLDAVMARLAAEEHGDLTDVAKEQGVSKEAVRASRQRMIQALRERMEVTA